VFIWSSKATFPVSFFGVHLPGISYMKRSQSASSDKSFAKRCRSNHHEDVDNETTTVESEPWPRLRVYVPYLLSFEGQNGVHTDVIGAFTSLRSALRAMVRSVEKSVGREVGRLRP
jgi:hypothetical protein